MPPGGAAVILVRQGREYLCWTASISFGGRLPPLAWVLIACDQPEVEEVGPRPLSSGITPAPRRDMDGRGRDRSRMAVELETPPLLSPIIEKSQVPVGIAPLRREALGNPVTWDRR